MPAQKAQIRLKIFDGARLPYTERQSVLLRIHNGQTTQSFTKTLNTKSLNEGEVLLNVDFFDNFADNYTVLISADDYRDAGFFPIKVSPESVRELSLMLVPQEPSFAFDPWDLAKADHPRQPSFYLSRPERGKRLRTMRRVSKITLKRRPGLLNLATAMSQIFLQNGTPLDYFRGIEWDSIAPDRFFGYATTDLVDEVKAAAAKKMFAPELDPQFFHGDATSSFKQIRFGEANVQLTFHEKKKKTIAGEQCIRIESDIDYFKDPAAHAF